MLLDRGTLALQWCLFLWPCISSWASSSVQNALSAAVWKHFEQIRLIPRCSGNEARMQDYIEKFAKSNGLQSSRDSARNIVVRRPGSSTGSGAPAVILQTHLDMVCEKDASTSHDWSRDPIIAVERDGWLVADKTTLGADNGIGVALSLALLEQPSSWKAPPLEAVFTVEEETGLHGALGLDISVLQGRRLLNFDSEEWGIIYIGCAGGGDSIIELPIQTSSASSAHASTYALTVSGLRGGHSGVDIHEGRGNALLLLARVLRHVQRSLDFGLYDMQGGNLDNAIPRQATAVIGVTGSSEKLLQERVAAIEGELRQEFGRVDPGLTLSVSKTEPSNAQTLLAAESLNRLLDLLSFLPAGVIKMSHEVEGLVETSNNVARVRRLETGKFEVLCLARSSLTPALTDTLDLINRIAERCGGTSSRKQFFPGWAPNREQALLVTAEHVFAAVESFQPNVTAIHAGLECGVIGGKVPGIEMISYGPDIMGAHAPGERVRIDSVTRLVTVTDQLLQRLADDKATPRTAEL